MARTTSIMGSHRMSDFDNSYPDDNTDGEAYNHSGSGDPYRTSAEPVAPVKRSRLELATEDYVETSRRLILAQEAETRASARRNELESAAQRAKKELDAAIRDELAAEMKRLENGDHR